MHRKTAKIISVIMSVLLVITMAGCFEDTDYYLESTGSSRPVFESSATTSTTTTSYVAKTFDMHRYPYYAMLSPKEMKAYSLIYDAVLNDHPELFWLENNY